MACPTVACISSKGRVYCQISNTQNPKGKFARWLTELEEYRYTIEYISGRYNQKADTLSQNQNASEWTDNNNNFEDKIYVMEIENLVEKINMNKKITFRLSMQKKSKQMTQ